MARQIHVPEYDRGSTVGRRGDRTGSGRDAERLERCRIRQRMIRILRDPEPDGEQRLQLRMW